MKADSDGKCPLMSAFDPNRTLLRTLNEVLVTVFLSACTWTAMATDGREACRSASPPKDATVVFQDREYWFVFPRALPERYTGCQLMWDSVGRRRFVLHFSNGELTQFDSHAGGGWSGTQTQICSYSRGVLLSTTSSDRCPAYQAVKGGIRIDMPKGSEPQVQSGDHHIAKPQ